MKDKKDISSKYEIGEDTTQYGEFVSSYFAWVPLSVQKEKVENLENATKEKIDKNKRKT